MADHLGISRVTLREVLKVLQDQGLVEARRGRYGGTFV
ncbi:GntR family transcriptional regulator, partial [Streptomyces sp. NRRL WC-3549]